MSPRNPSMSEFAATYRRYYEDVWRTIGCLGVPAHAVDDAVQEVFMIVHRRWHAFAADNGRAWIFGIARKVAANHRRKLVGRRREVPTATEPRAANVSPDEVLARQEAIAVVEAVLDGLPDEQRTVFVLAEIAGLSAPEISESLGSNLATVYSRLRLARARFDRAVQRMQARERGELERMGRARSE